MSNANEKILSRAGDRSNRHASLSTLLGWAGAAAGAYWAARAVARSKRWYDLNGKAAIVTGGSRGIGLQIALELARRGANITICARDEAELSSARQEIQRLGHGVLSVVCDVTQQDEIAAVVQQTRERFGRVDVLVNNAGTISVGPASHMSLADYRDAMDINFEAPLLFILDVLPEMRQRGSGRIVNVASFGGKVPTPHMAPYSASKFALVGLSETLRTELADDGVYVTTVCPGLVRSGAARINAIFKGQHEAERAWFTAGDIAPIITVRPDVLARRIVNALQHGDAELITPLVAAVQTKLHGVMPELSQEISALINHFLPGRSDSPDGDTRRQGKQLGDAGLPGPVLMASVEDEATFQYTNPAAKAPE